MWTLAGIGYRYVSLLIQKFTKRWRSHERQLILLFLAHVGPSLKVLAGLQNTVAPPVGQIMHYTKLLLPLLTVWVNFS